MVCAVACSGTVLPQQVAVGGAIRIGPFEQGRAAQPENTTSTAPFPTTCDSSRPALAIHGQALASQALICPAERCTAASR